MIIGDYVRGEKVFIPCVTHKFETGQKFDSTVSGWVLSVGADPADKRPVTFEKFADEKGLYVASLDTAGLVIGSYMCAIKAVIDGVDVIDTKFFSVIVRPCYYGISSYNRSSYI